MLEQHHREIGALASKTVPYRHVLSLKTQISMFIYAVCCPTEKFELKIPFRIVADDVKGDNFEFHVNSFRR